MKPKFNRKMQLAEMLLSLKLHGKDDAFRKKYPFSEDMAATQAILFSGEYDKADKVFKYRRWLEDKNNHPCVFASIAAKKFRILICLLEEREILLMKKGDEDLRNTIQDHRQVWKRYALDGFSSSFVILLVSERLVYKEPDEQLKEICRRLMELYLGVEPVADDTILVGREYVFLRQLGERGKPRILKFSTLPNIFCAQGDQRWWHDHRTPGGVMITSNALGHFAYAEAAKSTLDSGAKIRNLEYAMQTIKQAHGGPLRKAAGKLKHCPATSLLTLGQGETTPLHETSEMRKFSPDHYQGYFHTDHLIPSAFFRPERDPKNLKTYDKLSFRYIYDPDGDPKDHAELMTGVDASPFEVKQSMDRLPPSASPDKDSPLSEGEKKKLTGWLQKGLTERLQG